MNSLDGVRIAVGILRGLQTDLHVLKRLFNGE